MNWERKAMRHGYLVVMLLLVWGISGCGPGPFGGLFPDPTPTPPNGFVNLSGLTPREQFLKYPALSADGDILAAMGGLSREEPTFDRLFVIETGDNQVVFNTAEEKAWISLAISFDGKRIAACADQQIYLVDWKTDTTTYLTDGCWPTWSPSGTHLAYVLYTADRQQIRIRDLTTDVEDIIYDAPSTPFFLGDLVWSPTASKLAFAMAQDSQVTHLYTANIDGSDLHKIPLADPSQLTSGPHFSPDGNKLLYVELTSQYLRVADSGGPCRRFGPPVPGIGQSAMSPGGSRIAFGTNYGLMLADTETAFGKDFLDFWLSGETCTDS
jgi:Tol biopolymer transport system component